jgi:3-phytase
MKQYITYSITIAVFLMLSSCGKQPGNSDTQQDGASRKNVQVNEAWESVWDENDNVDSPAFWHSPDGVHLVIATAKSTDRLLVYEAASGKLLYSIGSGGSNAGEFRRPNGIAIMDNYAIIVERDNRRIQVFRLPEWTSLGFFGSDVLIKPYGVTITRSGDDFLLYITDNYETEDGDTPPESELGTRIKQFRMRIVKDAVEGVLLKSFGMTSGPGVLRVVESIWADTVHNRLLIADEDPTENNVKVYDLDGNFTGTIIGNGLFEYQPEGIVLYDCPDGNGYWIMTDQGKNVNTFLVFDRSNFEFLASFTGPATRNTDGIALTQSSFEAFPSGAFFAVHDDGGVVAFDWSIISPALGLARDCTR